MKYVGSQDNRVKEVPPRHMCENTMDLGGCYKKEKRRQGGHRARDMCEIRLKTQNMLIPH